MDKLKYDVIITGGGLVGLTAAIALSVISQRDNGRTLNIALVESKNTKKQMDVFEEPGSMALSWGTRLIYESLGIWTLIKNYAQPLTFVDVTDKEGKGNTQITADEYSLPALGYVIPTQTLQNELFKIVKNQKNTTVYRPYTIQEINSRSNESTVILNNETQKIIISSDLLIFASGATSKFIQQLGFQQKITDYGHSAFLATVAHQFSHKCCAYERFTSEGPMALLPMPSQSQNTSSLIWTMTHQQSEERLNLDEKELLVDLGQRFSYPMGDFVKIGKFLKFPMQLKIIESPVKQGCVLLGNSAHLLHPVAAQGYNLSIRDTLVLAKIIGQSSTKISVGSLELLNKYVKNQIQDQNTSIKFSDGLIKLFATSNKPITKHGRNIGLQLLNKFKPAKHWLANKTMGIGGFGK